MISSVCNTLYRWERLARGKTRIVIRSAAHTDTRTSLPANHIGKEEGTVALSLFRCTAVYRADDSFSGVEQDFERITNALALGRCVRTAD